uniref:alpha-1,6-mannosyl-glycoprotein 6-beta-N-acetylglucosaminyltransferase n=1 Tax=Ciona savignyi TaxID=51511 RepID=H2YVW6_CIOSA
MSALHALGHEVVLSWSPDRLKEVMLPYGQDVETCRPARMTDLVFTDIVGLEQIRALHGSLYHYRCILRVLDVYGTDPLFNHPLFNPEIQSTSWGGKGLDPAQFFTHFPHSPDNSFLGFVVQKYNISGDEEEVQDYFRQIALLYGKRPSVLNGRNKLRFIDLVNQHFNETHATMYVNVRNKKGVEMYESIPDYVINHRNLGQEEFRRLLRKARVYVGLGFPVDGPAALEAIASGVVYLNPRFANPRPVADKKPTNRKLTSQNPYAETRIGEPHVYTIDIRNLTHVEQVLGSIKGMPRPPPLVTHEFTAVGFLERLHAYLENQNFCPNEVQTLANSGLTWRRNKKQWPPKSVLKVKLSEKGESCTMACSRHKLVCERSLFNDVNNEKLFNTLGSNCRGVKQILPLEELEIYRRRLVYGKPEPPCHAPSISTFTSQCLLQTDKLLFSCACAPPTDVQRICPCREYGDQIALCVGCY